MILFSYFSFLSLDIILTNFIKKSTLKYFDFYTNHDYKMKKNLTNNKKQPFTYIKLDWLLLYIKKRIEERKKKINK